MSINICNEAPNGLHHFKGDACRYCGNTRHDLRNIRNAAAVSGFAECRRILSGAEEREKMLRRGAMGALIGVPA